MLIAKNAKGNNRWLEEFASIIIFQSKGQTSGTAKLVDDLSPGRNILRIESIGVGDWHGGGDVPASSGDGRDEREV